MAERPDEVTGRDRSVQQDEGTQELTPVEREELRERARSGDEVAAVRADIEQTRAELGETVDAIQERLSPQRLKEQAKARASSAASGTELLETIRQNPVPVAIAGGVIGLMLLRRLRGRSPNTVVIDLREGKIRRTGAARSRR